ncbi:MAG: indole-3-glycerol-phosphate synthase [Candidatus Verstraetearchaeota archaeon]|nr:indole-3-glycerol-phosphate synthase [Candidatus Verstraetearchaeota archaeon]
MADFLDTLAQDAISRVRSGYYSVPGGGVPRPCLSLKTSIERCVHAPIIAEVKPRSPSRGFLRRIDSPTGVVKAMERGGAVGISVLTEPKNFGGSIDSLKEARSSTELPILMKDIVVDPVQIEAASKFGASCVLFIFELFKRGYARHPLEEMIGLAHRLGLEVLLEAHTKEEFRAALETNCDLVGINNRDLGVGGHERL